MTQSSIGNTATKTDADAPAITTFISGTIKKQFRNIGLRISGSSVLNCRPESGYTHLVSVFACSHEACVVAATCRIGADMDLSRAFTFQIGGQLKKEHVDHFSQDAIIFPAFNRSLEGQEHRINTYGAFCLRHDPTVEIPSPTPEAQIETAIRSGCSAIEAFTRVFGRYLRLRFENRPSFSLQRFDEEGLLSDEDYKGFDQEWLTAIKQVADSTLLVQLSLA